MRPQLDYWVGKLHWRKDRLPTPIFLDFPIAQLVKNLPAMQETSVRFLGCKILWRRDQLPTPVFLGSSRGSYNKESTHDVGDLGSIPGLGRSPREGKGYSLQYSGLENSSEHIFSSKSIV